MMRLTLADDQEIKLYQSAGVFSGLPRDLDHLRQDPLARQANVMFGQKSWAKSGGVEGPEGEKYAAFSTPEDSVRAYMQSVPDSPCSTP